MGVSQFTVALGVDQRRSTVSLGYEDKTGIRVKKGEEGGQKA